MNNVFLSLYDHKHLHFYGIAEQQSENLRKKVKIRKPTELKQQSEPTELNSKVKISGKKGKNQEAH